MKNKDVRALVLGVCAMLAMGTAAFGTPVPWDWMYEADAAPNDAGSVQIRQGDGSYAADGTMGVYMDAIINYEVSSGIRRFTTKESIHAPPNDGPGFTYGGYLTQASYDATFNSDTGYTLEWRVKPVELTSAAIARCSLNFGDGRSGVDRFWYLNLVTDGEGLGVNLYGNDGTSNTTTPTVPISGDEFTTIRITVEEGVASFTFNDNPTILGSIGYRPIAAANIQMADGSGRVADYYAVWDVDYLRGYDGGAVVVPEPGSFVLLLGGAGLLAGLRKRYRVKK